MLIPFTICLMKFINLKRKGTFKLGISDKTLTTYTQLWIIGWRKCRFAIAEQLCIDFDSLRLHSSDVSV